MSYWEYIAKQTGLKFAGVVLAVFAVFFLAGLWMPEVKSWVELKHLAWIIGIPITLFFVGNYVAWKKLK